MPPNGQNTPSVFVLPRSAGGGFFDPKYLAEFKVQHTGVDYYAPLGTQIISHIDGNVTNGAISHPDNDTYMLIRDKQQRCHVFAHLRFLVNIGSEVKRGDVLGTILPYGSDGTKTHLHYGINLKPIPDYPKGWGWGRAPRNATIAQARAAGWVDPSIFVLSMKISH